MYVDVYVGFTLENRKIDIGLIISIASIVTSDYNGEPLRTINDLEKKYDDECLRRNISLTSTSNFGPAIFFRRLSFRLFDGLGSHFVLALIRIPVSILFIIL